MSSLRNFVSRVADEQLNQLLARHSIEPAAPFASPASIVEHIEGSLSGRGPGARTKLFDEIETIEKLASEVGERAIASLTLTEPVPQLPSREARALWLYLNNPEEFFRAEECERNDMLRYGRQWSAFSGPEGCDLRRDAASQAAFKDALRVIFDTPNVHLDIFDRNHTLAEDDQHPQLVQITIYRETLPNMEAVFINSEFTYQQRSRVVEAAVTYEIATGRIECVGQLLTARQEIVQHFARLMLGFDTEVELSPLRSYDLSGLLERMSFEVDADDKIEDVGVAMLRLVPVDTTSETITLERVRDNERDIWTIADDRLGNGVLATSYRIRQARISIRHRANLGNRQQTLQITITHPFKSNIKDQRDIERLVVTKYLPRWGLLVG